MATNMAAIATNLPSEQLNAGLSAGDQRKISVPFSPQFYYYITYYLFPLHIAQETLETWDSQIQSLCGQVISIMDLIGQAEPEWMAKQSANF